MPAYTTIKLDIDSKDDNVVDTLEFKLRYILHYFKGHTATIMLYETFKGYHVYIDIDVVFSDTELVAIQAILGSDWLRELRNLNRVKHSDITWNILFDTKFKKGELYMEQKYIGTYKVKL